MHKEGLSLNNITFLIEILNTCRELVDRASDDRGHAWTLPRSYTVL